MKQSIKTVAIIGAGKLGTVLAKLSLQAGYDVYIAGSESPEKIALTVSVLLPGAIATTTKEAVKNADIAILAIPLSKYRTLTASDFSGKLVIDATNYWWEVDGPRKDILPDHLSSSEQIQDYLKNSRIVKALSHMGYHHLLDEAKPEKKSDRKAIALAGNSPDDRTAIANFINSIGFDPVDIGKLSNGKNLEPGTKSFGANVDKKTLQSYHAVS